mgnify:CR=1 FL=1|tara:strand:- start:7504 stop:8268 length:765 start_codon:yes stop_codon:yes gene_type:complete
MSKNYTQNRGLIPYLLLNSIGNGGGGEDDSLIGDLTEQQLNSSYIERYEANFLSMDFNAAQDNAGNAGSGWCGERIEAKAQQLANVMMWNWGLIDGVDSRKWCWNCELICLWNCSCKKNYRGLGYEIDVFKARELINCERMESLQIIAEDEYEDAVNRVYNLSWIGGATRKNAKIDRRKWQIIKSFADGVVGSADEGVFDTCAEEGLQQVYDDAAAALQADIDAMDKPLSPMFIFGMIGLGAIGSIFIINKMIK